MSMYFLENNCVLGFKAEIESRYLDNSVEVGLGLTIHDAMRQCLKNQELKGNKLENYFFTEKNAKIQSIELIKVIAISSKFKIIYPIVDDKLDALDAFEQIKNGALKSIQEKGYCDYSLMCLSLARKKIDDFYRIAVLTEDNNILTF